MVEADDYEIGFAKSVLSGRHSIKPALVAISIGAVFAAWQAFFASMGDMDLGEKFAIFGLTLLFWVIWVAFADASISTARNNFRRHPVVCTLALLIFAYLALPSILGAIVSCLAAGSLAPVFGTIGIRFMFAPFVTEVALRLFLTVTELAGGAAGSRKKGSADEPRQATSEKDADH